MLSRSASGCHVGNIALKSYWRVSAQRRSENSYEFLPCPLFSGHDFQLALALNTVEASCMSGHVPEPDQLRQ